MENDKQFDETEKEKKERIKKADCIFLCVPIQNTKNWLLCYKRYLKNKMIIEQTSLKNWLFKKDLILKDLIIVSMHILFRPSMTPNLEDRNCFLIGDNNEITPQPVLFCKKPL